MTAQRWPTMHGLGVTTLPTVRMPFALSRAGTPVPRGTGFNWRSMVASGLRGLGQDPITDYYTNLAAGDTSGGGTVGASMPTNLTQTWSDPTSGASMGLDANGNVWNLNTVTVTGNVNTGTATVGGGASGSLSVGDQIALNLANAGIKIGGQFASYASPIYNPGTYLQTGPYGTTLMTAGATTPTTATTTALTSNMMPILLLAAGVVLVMMMGKR